MLFLRLQILIFCKQTQHFRFCARPLTLDIGDRLKHCQIKIHGRQLKFSPQSGLRHLILDGIARIQLRKTPNPAEAVIYVILDFPVILRYLLKLFHIFGADTTSAVLADNLAYCFG